MPTYSISLAKVGRHKYGYAPERRVVADNHVEAAKKLGISPYAMRTYGHIVEESSKYEVVVDSGIPYTENVSGDAELKKVLLKHKIRLEDNPDDFPYYDIHVFDEKERDVTDVVFARLGLNE